MMHFVWLAESSTEMRKPKESGIEKPCYFEGNSHLYKRDCLKTSTMTYFPKLKVFIFYSEFTEPYCIDHVNNYKHNPENY